MIINRSNIWLLLIVVIISYLGGFRAKNVGRGFEEAAHYVVELFRGIEAFRGIESIRIEVVEACYASFGTYQGCFNRDITQYGSNKHSHFDYSWNGTSEDDFGILAQRNEIDQGNPHNTILFKQVGNDISRKGTGIYWFIF